MLLSCRFYTFLILFLLETSTESNSLLHSFEIITKTTVEDVKNNTTLIVFLRLNWGSYSYECYTSTHTNDKYKCTINEESTAICDFSNYVKANGLYSISITIYANTNISYALMIDEIIVNLNNNAYYLIDSFCINDNNNNLSAIGYQQIYSTNCTDFDYEMEYEYIIINEKQSTLTVYFIDDIQLYTNSNEAGLIQNIDTKNEKNVPNIHYKNIKITSFGFTVNDQVYSHHDDDVILTLYWFDQILQCTFPGVAVDEPNTEFLCHPNNITLLNTNKNTEYKLKIEYNHKWWLFISNIIIIDLFGNRYDINHFCGAIQLKYAKFWQITNNDDLCNTYKLHKYQYIAMDNDEIFLTQIYLHFDAFNQNILNTANQTIIARISLPKIVSFGIETIVVPKYMVHLRLYWGSYLYICSLNITTANTLYLCVVDANDINVISNCSDPVINNQIESTFALTIELNPTNQLKIDYIYIVDETNATYRMEVFCQPLMSGDSPYYLARCADFNEVYRYYVLSLHRTIAPQNNTNSLVSLEFAQTLFDEYSHNEAYIDFVSEYSVGSELSCNLTQHTLIVSVNLSNLTKLSTDHINFTMPKLVILVIVISFTVVVVLCGALVGCYCYSRALNKQLSEHNRANDENVDKVSSVLELPGLRRAVTLTKRTSSLLSVFKTHSTHSILPDVPGIANHGADDEGSDDDSSLNTDESQKEESEYLQHVEGYTEETKFESAVHLQVLKANGDEEEEEDEEEKDDILLDGMLADVLKMESLDPYKLDELNKKEIVSEDDSGNSDDMYEKSDNDKITVIIPDEDDDEGMDEDEKEDIDYGYETRKDKIESSDDEMT